MLLMETHTWPMEKSADVGQVFVKVFPTLPPYIKSTGPFVTMGGDGVKGWAIWDVEKGYEEEGLMVIMKHLMECAKIGGQRFTLEPMLTGADALPLVGLSL